ncbi:probably inactive leucine-rich repeat receptor-like protein kinase At5g48380 [Glycine soja]|nr:probably inactive leucine-rich repeat receptor-like protein kinase At5g48380 [Glycine soja]
MVFQIKRDILMHAFWCSSLLSFCMVVVAHGVESDISCLKSIKNTLEDPHNKLSSWKNFNNKTNGFICDFVGVECWHPGENKVLHLNLTNMGLKGEFPRDLRDCPSLTSLNLSHNELTGPIPSDISTLLPYATSIDLSNNKFNGEIPPSLGNCSYLTSLRLDNNMLSGQIPQQLEQLPRLRKISFVNNNLSGPVPLFQPGLTCVDCYANNRELCGGPLPPCGSSDDFTETFKKGLAIGYAFSVTSVIVIYISYFAPWEQSESKHKTNYKAKEFRKYICSIAGRKTPTEPHTEQELQPLQLQEKAIKEISVVTDRMKSTMRLNEVRDATDCFSIDNAIGMGKIGIMYKGRLPNGWNLAIKRLFDSKLFKRQFLLEIRILGKYRHKNIVPLLGFCVEGKERILVYQYMSNGRLSKWLHPLESEVTLKWPQRIKIALGVARGLSWLHHICDLHVVHRNISSGCVLLDKNFEPKISNFGNAKFINPNIEDSASTTFYVSDGKKDVYDFGSLLFELITGKTLKELSCSFNTTNLSGNPSNFYNAIEESLIGEGFENEVYTLIKVACKCVKPFPDERPTMLEVYNYMIDIWGERHRISDGSDTLNVSSSSTSVDEIVEL